MTFDDILDVLLGQVQNECALCRLESLFIYFKIMGDVFLLLTEQIQQRFVLNQGGGGGGLQNAHSITSFCTASMKKGKGTHNDLVELLVDRLNLQNLRQNGSQKSIVRGPGSFIIKGNWDTC